MRVSCSRVLIYDSVKTQRAVRVRFILQSSLRVLGGSCTLMASLMVPLFTFVVAAMIALWCPPRAAAAWHRALARLRPVGRVGRSWLPPSRRGEALWLSVRCELPTEDACAGAASFQNKVPWSGQIYKVLPNPVTH